MNSLAPSVMMLSLAVVSALVINAVPILAPVAASSLALSPEYIGYFIAITYVTGMISALASGNFIVRYGAIRISQIGLFLGSLGLVLIASANLSLVVIGAIIIGIGYGPISPASSHVLARTTPPERMGITFSIRQTGNPLAGFLAGILVPGLVLLTSWQASLLIIAVFLLFFIWFAQPFRQELDSDRIARSPFSLKVILQPIQYVLLNPQLRELALVSFLFCGLQMILTSYLVTFLTSELHISFVAAGFALASTQLASVLARIAWGYVADRFMTPRTVLGLLGIVMAAASMATAAMSPSWSYSMVILLTAIFGSAAIGWNGVYMAEIARVAPHGTIAATTGASLFFAYLGGIVGPSSFAYVILKTQSYQYGFIIFGLLALIASASLILRKTKRSDT